MKITKKKLTDYRQTIKEILRIVEQYHTDLLKINKFGIDITELSPEQFFEFIKGFPYEKDFQEFLQRPILSLNLAGTGTPLDCDDRTILSCSYFRLNGYPYYINVVGRKEKPHHVYASFLDKRTHYRHTEFDPTYPHNEYGKEPFKPGYHVRFFGTPEKLVEVGLVPKEYKIL